MAQEIKITTSLTFAKAKVLQKNMQATFQPTWTGTNYKQGTQAIPTTAGGTALDVAGLANVGVAYFQNNDATNPVDIMDAVSGHTILHLLAGEAAVIRFPTTVTAPAAIATGGTVQLEFVILEI